MKSITLKISKAALLFSILFSQFSATAQAPNKFIYQAVVRNANNVIVASASVGMRISILQTTSAGTAVYVETHNPTTNANGLVSIEIGGGTLVSGNFSTINWGAGPYFIKTETDPVGGTSFSIIGTSQLLSVPYALFATNSSSSWNKTGNDINTTDFIGTTNDQDIIFKRDDIFFGRLNRINFSIGRNSLEVSTGIFNTAFGTDSNKLNTTGQNNTSMGYQSLSNNTTGSFNTVVGAFSGRNITTSTSNTLVGREAGSAITTGSSNTTLGRAAGFNITTGSNNTAIGNNALVPNATSSNQVQIGNIGVTYAGVQVAWTITSDSRWKSDIQKSNLGLDFIKNLNPVSYTRKNDENKKVEYGFIAQEIEASLLKFNALNNGIISKDDAGMIGVRYNDFFAPIVKSVQELDEKNIDLHNENKVLLAKLDEQNKQLKDMMKRLEKLER